MNDLRTGFLERHRKRLRVETMRAFISHHQDGIEEMHSKLERVEVDLAAAQKPMADKAEKVKLAEGEKGAIRAEAD